MPDPNDPFYEYYGDPSYTDEGDPFYPDPYTGFPGNQYDSNIGGDLLSGAAGLAIGAGGALLIDHLLEEDKRKRRGRGGGGGYIDPRVLGGGLGVLYGGAAGIPSQKVGADLQGADWNTVYARAQAAGMTQPIRGFAVTAPANGGGAQSIVVEGQSNGEKSTRNMGPYPVNLPVVGPLNPGQSALGWTGL